MKDLNEVVILVKKTAKANGGYRAAIYSSGYGAKQKQVFAKTIKEALIALAELYLSTSATENTG